DPVREIAPFGKISEANDANVGDDSVQHGRGLGHVCPPRRVVVLTEDHRLLADEPPREAGRELAGAARVAGGHEPDRKGSVGVLLSLSDYHQLVGLGGDQLREPIRNRPARRLSFYPPAVFPMLLKKPMGRGAVDTNIWTAGWVFVDVTFDDSAV